MKRYMVVCMCRGRVGEKRNRERTCATTWMNLENIVLVKKIRQEIRLHVV